MAVIARFNCQSGTKVKARVARLFTSVLPRLWLIGRSFELAFLMQYLKWEKANIVGLSMGGAIAASFTSQFTYLVDEGVGLIASAGLMEVCAIASFQYHSTNRSSRVTSHAHLNLCPPRSSRRWHPRGRSRYVCTRP